MRTTLTLDDDIAAKVREEMLQSGTTMKQVVNVTLRRGFDSPSEAKLAKAFKVAPRRMGLRAGWDLDDIGGLLNALDGPAHR